MPQVVKSEKKDEVEETPEEEDEYAGLSLMEIHKKKMEKGWNTNCILSGRNFYIQNKTSPMVKNWLKKNERN